MSHSYHVHGALISRAWRTHVTLISRAWCTHVTLISRAWHTHITCMAHSCHLYYGTAKNKGQQMQMPHPMQLNSCSVSLLSVLVSFKNVTLISRAWCTHITCMAHSCHLYYGTAKNKGQQMQMPHPMQLNSCSVSLLPGACKLQECHTHITCMAHSYHVHGALMSHSYHVHGALMSHSYHVHGALISRAWRTHVTCIMALPRTRDSKCKCHTPRN